MITRNSYLLKDGKIYYFRIKVPKYLRKYFKSSQIKKSLYTKDFDRAKKRLFGALNSKCPELILSIELEKNTLKIHTVQNYEEPGLQTY